MDGRADNGAGHHGLRLAEAQVGEGASVVGIKLVGGPCENVKTCERDKNKGGRE